jgi:VanZ family protein
MNRWLTLLACAYSGFVLYGSLVPLDPRTLSLNQAVTQFSAIPYLSIGAYGRADLIANVLLYIPLAFLWCARFSGPKGRQWMAAVLVLVGCLLFALAIEFAQLWFPPRTVSQNDLMAETLGVGLGLLIWLAFGGFLFAATQNVAHGGRSGLKAAFAVYCGAYLFYVLLPFDFVFSASELSRKFETQAIAPFLSGSCGGTIRCGANLALEIASFVPLGIFLTVLLAWSGNQRPGFPTAALIGIMVGLVIEGLQILIVSGITQGLSVATRAAGVVIGMGMVRMSSMVGLKTFLPMARPLIFLGLIFYAMLLIAVSWRGEWQVTDIVEQLGAVNWLPFYYHYFTTEQNALVSMIRNIVLYAPLGPAVWAWRFAGARGERAGLPGAGVIFWLGAALAALMEFSRLFKTASHPDPTNVLIGAASAWGAYHLTAWLAGCFLDNAKNSGSFLTNRAGS